MNGGDFDLDADTESGAETLGRGEESGGRGVGRKAGGNGVISSKSGVKNAQNGGVKVRGAVGKNCDGEREMRVFVDFGGSSILYRGMRRLRAAAGWMGRRRGRACRWARG